jgi:hypothetical protein
MEYLDSFADVLFHIPDFLRKGFHILTDFLVGNGTKLLSIELFAIMQNATNRCKRNRCTVISHYHTVMSW